MTRDTSCGRKGLSRPPERQESQRGGAGEYVGVGVFPARSLADIERKFGEPHEPARQFGKWVDVVFEPRQGTKACLEGKVAALDVGSEDRNSPDCGKGLSFSGGIILVRSPQSAALKRYGSLSVVVNLAEDSSHRLRE